MSHKRLDGKSAIVVGAGARGEPTGTGFAAAMLFAKEGAQVLLVDYDQDRAEASLLAIEEAGGCASIFLADVTNEDNCRDMVATCSERYGALHILYNNVATGGSGTVTDIQEAELDEVLALNLKSAIFTCKHAIPAMKESGGGSIINIASIDGLRAGGARNVPYAVTKAGMIQLTRVLAVHHGRDNIRVNCIAPGHIYAPFVRRIDQETRARRRKIAPLGTEGTAWDVAWAALFLASDEARWISGVVLPVDAGLLAATPLAVYDNLS